MIGNILHFSNLQILGSLANNQNDILKMAMSMGWYMHNTNECTGREWERNAMCNSSKAIPWITRNVDHWYILVQNFINYFFITKLVLVLFSSTRVCDIDIWTSNIKEFIKISSFGPGPLCCTWSVALWGRQAFNVHLRKVWRARAPAQRIAYRSEPTWTASCELPISWIPLCAYMQRAIKAQWALSHHFINTAAQGLSKKKFLV